MGWRWGTRWEGRWLAVLAMVVALGGGLVGPGDVGGWQGTPEAGDAPAGPLDLAAMALTPADLAEAGLPGYTTAGGAWLGPEAVVAEVAAGLGLDGDEVEEGLLDEAGLGASYGFALELIDPEDEASTVLGRVRTYLSEHGDEGGAAAGFALREDDGDRADAEDVEDAGSFGDESELTRFGEGGTGDDAAARLDLTLRVGRVYGGVELTVFGGEAATETLTDEIGALGERLEAKIRAGLAGEAPGGGLSLLVQRLGGEAARETVFDQYDFVEGAYAPYPGEAAFAADQGAALAGFGTTARYTLRQAVDAQVGGESGSGLVYTAQLYAFGDAGAAEAFVGDGIGFLEGNASNADVDVAAAADALDGLGDASTGATYTVDLGAGPTDGVVAYLAVGKIGAIVFVEGNPRIGPETLGELAAAQVACLEAGACPDAVEAATLGGDGADEDGAGGVDLDVETGKLDDDADTDTDLDGDGGGTPAADDAEVTPTSNEDAVADDETPEEEATAEATADADGAGDDGAGAGVYESPNYGFVLTWDAGVWGVVLEDEEPEDAYDSVYLYNDVSVVGVTGDPDYGAGDLAACVETYVGGFEREIGNSGIEPLDEPDAAANRDGISWATYSYVYTDEDEVETEWIRYYGCQVIGSGVTLVVYHDAPVDEYADQIGAREALLDGLDVP